MDRNWKDALEKYEESARLMEIEIKEAIRKEAIQQREQQREQERKRGEEQRKEWEEKNQAWLQRHKE